MGGRVLVRTQILDDVGMPQVAQDFTFLSESLKRCLDLGPSGDVHDSSVKSFALVLLLRSDQTVSRG